jgi:hypothetical protein
MLETTWIIDAQSGALTVEGLRQSELTRLATDLLATGKQVNCARPINIEPLQLSSAHAANDEPSLRSLKSWRRTRESGGDRRINESFIGLRHAVARLLKLPTLLKSRKDESTSAKELKNFSA